MKLIKVLIGVTADQKQKLDTLRRQGYTASGYVRNLLDRDLNADKRHKGQ